MPGTLSPDALLIEKQFPPSPSTIRALLAAGFRFKSVAPHGDNDYWFMKPIPADDLGGDRVMILHLVDEANQTGRVILKLRDACNNDPNAFEEYKVRFGTDGVGVVMMVARNELILSSGKGPCP